MADSGDRMIVLLAACGGFGGATVGAVLTSRRVSVEQAGAHEHLEFGRLADRRRRDGEQPQSESGRCGGRRNQPGKARTEKERLSGLGHVTPRWGSPGRCRLPNAK